MRSFSHACDNGVDHANGVEILAPSDAIDVCASKHQPALIGGGWRFRLHLQGQRPEDRSAADKRKPLFALANYERKARAIVCFSKKRERTTSSKRSAPGRKNEISKRGAKRESVRWRTPLAHSMDHTIVICIETLLWYHKLFHTRLQGVGSANPLAPLYGV